MSLHDATEGLSKGDLVKLITDLRSLRSGYEREHRHNAAYWCEEAVAALLDRQVFLRGWEEGDKRGGKRG